MQAVTQYCRRSRPSALETMLGGMFDTRWNRIMQEFFNDDVFKPSFRDKHTYPKIDVISYKDRVEFQAGIPGMNEDDVEVRIDGDLLILSGKKRQKETGSAGTEHGDVIYQELKHSAFTRVFDLKSLVGDYDEKGVEAVFHNGMLTVKLPRTKALEDTSHIVRVKSLQS
jgi:HSP20 family molecular chaperone IbpA